MLFHASAWDGLTLVLAAGFFWIPLLMAGLAAAGAAGRSRSQNRQEQNQVTQQNNQAAVQQQQTQQQALMQALGLQESAGMNRALLDLNQRRFQQEQRDFALNAPTTRGRQALTGSLMQNLQPMRMSGLPSRISRSMPTITGGLSPSAIGPDARLMGQLMSSNAIQGQQRGDSIDSFGPPPPTPDFRSGVLPPAAQGGYQQPSRMESILGLLGAAGSAMGGYQSMTGGGNGQAAAQPYGMSNRMPPPYTGFDQYGNPQAWQLPRGGFAGGNG